MNHINSEKDIEFKRKFETCEFQIEKFDHQAHLQLAYVYLTENSVEESIQLVKSSLKQFLDFNNIDPNKYHETLTKAWILAVDYFMNKTVKSISSDDLIAQNKDMLNSKIMMTHYSAEVLFSDQARQEFIKPNLDPIPKTNNT